MVRCGRTTQTSAQPPDTLCSLGGGAVREGSVLNLCKRAHTFLVSSVMEIFEEVQGGSMWSNQRTTTRHSLFPRWRFSWGRFSPSASRLSVGLLPSSSPSRLSVGGSTSLTLPQLHAGGGAVREGSVLNLCKRAHTFLVSSAMEMFEEVQGGSMWSNHPEPAHNHPTLLVPPVEVQLGKVQSLCLSALCWSSSLSLSFSAFCWRFNLTHPSPTARFGEVGPY